MNHKISDYLTKFGFNIRLLIMVLIFAVVFVFIYSPFDESTWVQSHNDVMSLVYSSIAVGGCFLVLVLCRLVLCLVGKKEQFTLLPYAIWIFVEIVIIAIVYTVYAKFIMSDTRTFNIILQRALLFIPLNLVIPYLVAYLYFSLKDKNNKISELQNLKKLRYNSVALQQEEIYNFCDENGKLKLSIPLSEVYLLAAADNYVNIYYNEGDSSSHYMLRGNLKDLEEQLSHKGFYRCHRSYLVNLCLAKMLSKEKGGLYLVFDLNELNRIPVSKTYEDTIVDAFARKD